MPPDSLLRCRYFNPRSHTGSDLDVVAGVIIAGISIHAPTRGATLPLLQISGNCLFQSTLPHGERLGGKYMYVEKIKISIHAPTRGATTLQKVQPSLCGFQSTLPHGERQLSHVVLKATLGFQSTLPHGERLVGDYK